MFPKSRKTDNKYFSLSGIIAISIYIVFFMFFILYIYQDKAEQYDAFSKDTVLELEILIVDKSEDDRQNINRKTKSIKSEEFVEKSKSISAKTKTNVKSLFANVKVDAKVILEQKVLNVRKTLVTSRFKSKFEKQKKSNSVSVAKLLDNVKDNMKTTSSIQSKNKNDVYFSKIYQILTQRWTPMFINEKLSAEVLIMITSSGQLAYRFRKVSISDRFNDRLEEFLNNQRLLTYPKHNKGKVIQIEVKFTTEGLE